MLKRRSEGRVDSGCGGVPETSYIYKSCPANLVDSLRNWIAHIKIV